MENGEFVTVILQAINDLRQELREFREENNRRWEENKQLWAENEKRWKENEKRWEENKQLWIEYKRNREQDRNDILDILVKYDISISTQLKDPNVKKMKKIVNK